MKRIKGLIKLAAPGVATAFLVVLVAACSNEAIPSPQPTQPASATPVIPTATATPSPTAISKATATATPFPEPTDKPTAIPKAETILPPALDSRDAIKAEVTATVHQFGQALSTADAELLASLFLQSEKTSSFASSEPLRVNGWSEVEGTFKRLISLPPGSVSFVLRQENLDLLTAEAALWTGHFILNIRQPEEPRQTIEGRITTVLQKVYGKWLRVHMHTSVLPR